MTMAAETILTIDLGKDKGAAGTEEPSVFAHRAMAGKELPFLWRERGLPSITVERFGQAGQSQFADPSGAISSRPDVYMSR
jgi:hypothetical protein